VSQGERKEILEGLRKEKSHTAKENHEEMWE
jgi:hypothetical protein